jgi:hypothetical protein
LKRTRREGRTPTSRRKMEESRGRVRKGRTPKDLQNWSEMNKIPEEEG